MLHATAADLLSRISTREARAGVVGLGYVGLPLAMSLARAGYPVTGFDIDPPKIEALHRGESYIEAVTPEMLTEALGAKRFEASCDLARLAECDVIAICVPTPLTAHREPDLRFVEQTARDIARVLRPGQLIVLESTTWPGTTDAVLRPILEETALKSGKDFFVGFSPEREDPGNRTFATAAIPKVVAGDGPAAQELITAFYAAAMEQVVPVSTTATAEAVKITENIFRAVNIALVNELKIVYDAMGIDIWEVIEAAKTKPFGYMPFYPGPGLGGHCIPIDPFYLTWKSREYELPTRFIELAGEINAAMPRHVVSRLAEALDRQAGKALSRSRILLLGMAYKKNVPDLRESPSLKLMELLEERGAEVLYHDPHIPSIPGTRVYGAFKGRSSVPLNAEILSDVDAVLISTDHDGIDYGLIAGAKLVVDTRNVMSRSGHVGRHIVKA
ncbi:nucleotide sugar dehydrogenase [Paracoccus aestuariivivens]|uniref:Nucleotide sugar dehydrogenase n=1 Tax=Paracoccus aestuariivivens TaxID=1820333 RepID=A0A6L6JD94_9RHOB|nr:nucleotide sugar dehydrogenase [Paracoccus aestuariivivens]MTH77891.1 nucleotide sugar dehydrogenase [Paracoccus aestuariivivens]